MARKLVLFAALVTLVAAPAARADGDPASDYLLGQATYIAPDVVPATYANQLTATVREAKVRGYAIRVAVIGTRYDLGSITFLYNKPQQYARFLGTELSFVYKGRLLVVMPSGLAVTNDGKPLPQEQAVVDRITPPGKSGPALATTAGSAVIKLAAAAGVVVPSQPLPGAASGSSTTRDRLTIAGAALIAALVVGAVLFYRRRHA